MNNSVRVWKRKCLLLPSFGGELDAAGQSELRWFVNSSAYSFLSLVYVTSVIPLQHLGFVGNTLKGKNKVMCISDIPKEA